eukprot:GHVR01121440.1.p1 GENE.GHVR01121440.1~~GHVR01121440.1.p1  ORF type:complete len:134 (+),score=12.28 GHVR01121440.1:43-444(+)
MFFIKVLIVIGVVSANDICAPPPIPKLPLLDGWWHYDTYNTSLYHNNTTHNNTTHNNTTHNNTTQALCIQIAAYRLCEGILVLSESAPIICTSLASHHSPVVLYFIILFTQYYFGSIILLHTHSNVVFYTVFI